ncbi:hypothetical protein ACI79G_04115 [Geodermatophilus sp. SYSU D00779]
MVAAHPLNDLARVVLAPTERWGWEFVDPGVPRPSPLLASEPRWAEPMGPDVRHIRDAQQRARYHLGRKIAIVVVIVLVSMSFASDGGWLFFLGALGLGYYWFAPLLLAESRISKVRGEADQRRAQAWQQFQEEHARWQRDVSAHDAAEGARVSSRDAFFPLELDPPPSRVDVFGGTGRGWVNLLTTMGGSVLGSRTPMVMVDLTQHRLSAALQEVAGLRGLEVRRHEFPDDLAALLSGLGSDELAEVLAEAVHTGRSGSDRQDLVPIGADLLRVVLRVLGGQVSARRIAAGLRVLDRTYFDDPDDILTFDERSRLSERVDLIGQTERTRDELGRLISAFDRLGAADGAQDAMDPAVPTLEADVPLLVLETAPGRSLVTDLVDAVLFHAVSGHVSNGSSWVVGRVVVVVGADRMGVRALEELHRQARRRRVRLVFLFEHLRDDLQQLIGGADSAALIMRLANHQEAEVAANFIGKGHKYVLGQVTRSLGETDTVGGGTSQTTTDTYSETFGRTVGNGSSRSYSEAYSVAQSFTASENWSRGTTTTHGTTDTRVYEFMMEPTQIADLPETAFVLIDYGLRGRRVVVGDSDPKYYLLGRVSDRPRKGFAETPEVTGSTASGQTRQGAVPGPDSIKIPDPSRSLVAVADRIRDLGYVVRYEEERGSPALHGWKVTRGDGCPLDELDQQHVQQAYASHAGRR